MAYLLLFCRLLIGVVFAVSAVRKVRGREAYSAFLAATGALAPRSPRRIAGPVVIAGEAATAVLLAVPATAGAGFVLAALLLAAFTAAIAAALRARRRVSCNCFGTSSLPVGPAHLIRNGVLLTGSLAGAGLALGAPGPAALEPAGAATAVVTALLGAGLVLLTEDIAESLRPLA